MFQSQRRLKGSRTEICITVKTVSCLKHNHRHRNIYIIHAVPCTKYSTSGCLSPPGGEPVIPSLVLDLSLLTCELNLWLRSCWIHDNAWGIFLPNEFTDTQTSLYAVYIKVHKSIVFFYFCFQIGSFFIKMVDAGVF